MQKNGTMQHANHDSKKRYASGVIKLLLTVIILFVWLPMAALAQPAPEEDSTLTEFSENADYPPLVGDDAYVSSIEITEIVDGMEPWDADSVAGNDASDSNKIVRSFDSVTYMVKTEMSPHVSTDAYGEARVKMEFVLPLPSDMAEFDTEAMAWMDTTDTYKWKITTEERDINGTQTSCQVLTCYKHLLPPDEEGSVIPGNFTENVTIKVKAMANNSEITPIFSAALEHNTWDGACPEHNVVEKKTVTPAPVKVSAAPKYNVLIKDAHEAWTMWKGVNDYNTGSSGGDYPAANYGIGELYGRTYCYGVTVMLYNDYVSKGLKGIEMPQGDITLDLKVSSKYQTDEGGNLDVTGDYLPRLWAYDSNKDNSSTIDGRTTSSPNTSFATSAAPFAEGGGTSTCYQSGNWQATQNEETISITISDYKINTESFPTRFASQSSVDPVYGQANVGMFSAGKIYIQQPFNKVGSENTSLSDFDVVKEHGAGTFTLTVEDINLKTESITGQTQNDNPGTNDAQMNKDDDIVGKECYLNLSGKMSSIIFYTDADNKNIVIRGVDKTAKQGTDGTDAASNGDEIALVGAFYYVSNGEEENRLQYATTLLKFDGSALEPNGKNYYRNGVNGGYVGINQQILYAVKADGTNWIDEGEMRNAQEDDLVYYASLEEIPSGNVCVGALIVHTGPATSLAEFQPFAGIGLRIKEDAVKNNVYMATVLSRVWTTSDLAEGGVTLEQVKAIDWTNEGTTLSSFPTGYYTSFPKTYVKESYYPNGGKIGTHTGGYYQGDSLLIVGYKTSVTKNMEQKTEDQVKNTYNVDYDQRIVDFVLQPGTQLPGTATSEVTTTITIVDTLPHHLTYKGGSSYFGGTYQQTSESGGTQGIITDGTLREPVITEGTDSAGKSVQILTWIITDVTIGSPMPAIHYSAVIGTKGIDETDIPLLTTNLVNTVRIYGTDDNREISLANGNYAEVGLSVVRGQASSFAKTTKTPLVDSDGISEFTIRYSNNSGSAIDKMVLLDTMPHPGDKGGSHFSGTYEVSGWSIDTSKATISNLDLWYTTDELYRDATSQTVSYDEIIGGWTKGTISSDGKSASMDGSAPVAWALVGKLNAKEIILADIEIKLAPQTPQPNDKYVNFVSQGNSTSTADVSTVSRTLEGLTWIDKNMDGIQDDEETRISGVKVTLLKLKDGGDPAKAEDYTIVVDSVETGNKKDVATGEETAYELGRYKFTGVPAGTYAVRFESGGESIAQYKASPKGQGSNPALDSDGEPTYDSESSELLQTISIDIALPEAKDMKVALYESQYHDSGFYLDGTPFSFTKVDDEKKGLAGAEFKLYRLTCTDTTHTHDGTTAELIEAGCYTAIQEGGVDKVWTSASNGLVSFDYLINGTYILLETKAPDGFQLPAGQWKIVVNSMLEQKVTITAIGTPPAFYVESGSYYLPNYKKPVLPVSGGLGTLLFTAGGTVLISVAVLINVLTGKKKMKP